MIAQHGIRDEINKLIRYYFDAKEDYRLAAKRAKPKDEHLCDELGRTTELRERFHAQLQEIETRMDVEQSDNGHVGADFRRDWERLRGTFTGHGLESALQLAQHSDRHALAQADRLIEIGLPEPLQSTIRQQRGELEQALVRLDGWLASTHA